MSRKSAGDCGRRKREAETTRAFPFHFIRVPDWQNSRGPCGIESARALRLLSMCAHEGEQSFSFRSIAASLFPYPLPAMYASALLLSAAAINHGVNSRLRIYVLSSGPRTLLPVGAKYRQRAAAHARDNVINMNHRRGS